MKLLNFSNTELLIGLIVLALALPPAWLLIAQTRARPRIVAAAVSGHDRVAWPDRTDPHRRPW
ncbi:MAG TPA: hypothetical protein VND96_12275 [Candidatus Micrarchaeaceae archaeon]|nr:hypothetical protein [Candidatus Micrarchaeaceae archaeon]